MQEIWKDIKGYEGCYQVSNLGRVKSLTRKVDTFNGVRTAKGQLLKPILIGIGYLRVDLKQHQKHYYASIHRLVAQTFIPNPNNYPIVNHINGDKQDNRVENLEWCTQSHNVKESYRIGNAKPTSGCFKKGSIPHNRKAVEQYDLNGNFIAKYKSIRIASKSTNTNPLCIGNCCRGVQKTSNGFIWRYAD